MTWLAVLYQLIYLHCFCNLINLNPTITLVTLVFAFVQRRVLIKRASISIWHSLSKEHQ